MEKIRNPDLVWLFIWLLSPIGSEEIATGLSGSIGQCKRYIAGDERGCLLSWGTLFD